MRRPSFDLCDSASPSRKRSAAQEICSLLQRVTAEIQTTLQQRPRQQKKLQVPRELVARPTPRPPPLCRRSLKPRRHHLRHRGCGTRHLASLRPPTFPVVCCSVFVFVFASFFSLFVSTQGIGAFRSLLPASLSEHVIDRPGSQPIVTEGPRSVCNPCSRAQFGRATTACVSSPKRLSSLHGLAHAAGHGCFSRASTPGAPFLLHQTVHVTKPRSKTIGGNLSPGMPFLGTCFNASLPPGQAQDVFFIE